MITLNLPDLPERPLQLESDIPVTKGGTRTVERLPGILSISDPRCMRLTPELSKDDPETSNFMAAYGTHADFFLVCLTCTFYPNESEPFHQAWLHVDLVGIGESQDRKPEVWSMRPARLAKNVEISHTAKIGASLKFMDLGIESGGEEKSVFTEENVYLQAYELSSNPFWEFQRSDYAEIKGSYRLAMVVKMVKSASGQAEARMRATIRRKRIGLIPYHTDFPDAPKISVKLEG